LLLYTANVYSSLSVCLSVFLSQFVFLSLCLSVPLSFCLSLLVCLSVSPTFVKHFPPLSTV
jgi:hypothetical protein